MEDYVYDSIKATIGSRVPESGGILGGNLEDNPLHINRFHDLRPAFNGSHTGASAGHFSPDHLEMNHVIDNIWTPLNYWINGVIHSHPGSMSSLSQGMKGTNDGDVEYFTNLLNHEDSIKNGLNVLIAPIVTFSHAGDMNITTWTLTRKNPFPRKARLLIVHDEKVMPVALYEELFIIDNESTYRIQSK